MEASDWNETSELKYLTHWMPLPSPPDDVAAPAEQQAAPKAAPGGPSYSEKWDAELGRTAMRFVDRAGDVHPGIDDAETICSEFYKAMSEVIERMPHVQRMAAPQQEAQEPVAWESTTPGYIKYITQARYEKFSPAVRRWYKPYRCSGCAERGAGFDACDMATAAAQGFRSGQAAAKQEE